MPLCQTCLQIFSENGPKACRFHPESYSGETSQRWRAPGDTGGGDIHFFWTCCGAGDKNAKGCSAKPHISFDEDEEPTGRRPGMDQY